MKKLVAFMALGVLALGVAGCDSKDKGNTVELVYSGTQSDKDFTLKLIDNFKTMKKESGDDTNYVIDYVSHGPDMVDSEIIDWTAANSPDVYEYAPDKLAILYDKGALAEIRSTYKDFIDTKINDFGKSNATLNGKYYGYPYTGDNTYYFQYDKRVFTSEDVKSMERILEVAAEKNAKVAYPLETAFWGAGVMFTFGADYSIEFDRDGKVAGVTADFDTDKGLKGAKALVKIMQSPAYVNDADSVPSETNGIVGGIAGTWKITDYKKALGENYGCAPMPTITIGEETKNIGAFVGGKLLGVNPLRAQNDVKRLTAAHELAMYLAGEECQNKRYDELSWGPCNVDSLKRSDIQADANMVVLNEQLKFAHAQTSTPTNLWDAATKLVAGIKDGTYSVEGKTEGNSSIAGLTFTDETLKVAIDTYNTAVKSSE